MKRKALTLLTATALSASLALADENRWCRAFAPHYYCRKLFRLALKHQPQRPKIAQFGVDEKQHAKGKPRRFLFHHIHTQ